ncbi:NAD(P)H-binding protein [Algoriphagus sp. AGSA1]|uniref:NAD(P)H-binding protein n=1 Tax=Algoriphagus sp. AGSA1 TaxID=2907213 RepID=UPI001F1BD303|nr:NAD(P)H-binding protein [Algoriphagus sp. AGSA1]MCE7054259.1 NAD(P)H-binding protein [Algoriphagus sp. AGSA1]
MKIILGGSLGHISKPLTEELLRDGHQVVVISSNKEREKQIQALGAEAAIGSLSDADFLSATFAGADLVYTMVPPANYFDHSLDLLAYYRKFGRNYAKAITQSGVKRVINLSSIGAHMDKGNGILQGTYHVEQLLNDLPADVSITHIRPTEFYYNLLPHSYTAKNKGYIAFNISNGVINSWVSPLDIADVIAAEISTPFAGRKVRYVASEEIAYGDLIRILGKAIGNPELAWLTLTDEQMREGLITAGMNPTIAADMTEMYAAINTGLLYEDYRLNRPLMGKVKVNDFALDFANAYKQIQRNVI